MAIAVKTRKTIPVRRDIRGIGQSRSNRRAFELPGALTYVEAAEISSMMARAAATGSGAAVIGRPTTR